MSGTGGDGAGPGGLLARLRRRWPRLRLGLRRPAHTMRGRIVARYLAVLAALLVVSAAFQYAALRRFLVEASVARLAAGARGALLQYAHDGDALRLARAVSDPRTAAWVLDTSGRVMAASEPPFASAALSGPPAAAGPRQQVSGGLLIVRLPLRRLPFGSAGGGRRPAGGFGQREGTSNGVTLPVGGGPPPPSGGGLLFGPFRHGGFPPGGFPPGPGSVAPAAGTLVLATPTDDLAAVLGAELDLLGLGGLAVLAAAGAVGAWVLGQGLRPLEAVAATADAVAGGDLGQRATVEGAPEEVARVGRAFNAMLDRLSEALAHEQQAREQMRRLLADASHELRTPVTSIAGFLEVLRAGAARDPDTLDRSLGTAHAQARRMALLVDQLLSLARLEQPAPLHLEPTDLARWLDGLRPEVEQAAGEHPLHWHTEGAGPLRARIDPEPLARALLNLVENAAKYSPAEAPIEVAVAAAPAVAASPEAGTAGPETATEEPRAAGQFARLTVTDHGPGIPAAELPLVFERFRRGSAAQEGRIPGTGLGLAIVDAVTRAHGGRVKLESPPEGGTRASILIPLEP